MPITETGTQIRQRRCGETGKHIITLNYDNVLVEILTK